MAKRFTDTELYEKDWFVALSPDYKLFWHYITSKCDTAGIWDVNIITACRIIGMESIDIVDFAEKCNADGKERIIIFCGGRKLFITTTVSFQCGTVLNTAIPAHRGIITSLSAHKETLEWYNQQLSNSCLTLSKGYATLKDKDKDKDKDSIIEIEGVQGEKGEADDPEDFTPVESVEVVNTVENRKVKFLHSCETFVPQYGEDMIKSFCDYWTEKTKSGKQMRFELERTWELSRRLSTWFKREEQYNRTRGHPQKSKGTSLSQMADIAAKFQYKTSDEHGTHYSTS